MCQIEIPNVFQPNRKNSGDRMSRTEFPEFEREPQELWRVMGGMLGGKYKGGAANASKTIDHAMRL
jgi:hypothetical protein